MKFLQALLGRKAAAPSAAPFVETAPNEIVLEGAPPFPIAKSIVREHGFPLVDWDAVNAWLAQVDTARRNEAWKACERGWLMHLEAALGANYRLAESPIAVVLSSLEDWALEAPAEQAQIVLPWLAGDSVILGAAELAFADLFLDPATVLAKAEGAMAAIRGD